MKGLYTRAQRNSSAPAIFSNLQDVLERDSITEDRIPTAWPS